MGNLTLIGILAIFLYLVFTRKWNRLWLLLIIPAFSSAEQGCGRYSNFQEIRILPILFSIIDLITELLSSNHGLYRDNHSVLYFDSYLLIQIYSCVFGGIMVYLFYNYDISFYKIRNTFDAKFSALTLIVLALSCFCLYYSGDPHRVSFIEANKQNITSVLVAIGFYTIAFMFIYKLLVVYSIDKMKELLPAILILSFPIICVGENFRSITICDPYDTLDERLVTVKPLALALITMLRSTKDFFEVGVSPLFLTKVYSIFQIIAVAYLIPFVLISKQKNHAR